MNMNMKMNTQLDHARIRVFTDVDFDLIRENTSYPTLIIIEGKKNLNSCVDDIKSTC